MLPSQWTRFFGREAELAELSGVVGEARLLSLVGPPGCGKTRLVIEVGSHLDHVDRRFAGGVRFVELAPVSDPLLVAGAVAAELTVGEVAGQALDDTLVEALSATGDPLLLLLDNCEHVADTAAELVQRLVTECPAVHVVMTSRAAIGVPGERVWQVRPLDLPAATQLFVDRAGLASRVFRIDGPDDEALVEKICLQLDCLPLAIELTAVWTRVLSLGQIAERLADALLLLARDDPGGTTRLRTMAAAVEWSYQLLPPDARRLFGRLAVFAGEFALEAVEAVAAPSDDVLGALTTLVDHSLVVAVGEEGGCMRYRVLEPVRQCGEALLAATDERDAVRRLHAEHYLRWAHRFDPQGLRGVCPTLSQEALALEESNLVAALVWARSQQGDLGLRLCVAMAPYWLSDGRVSDGRMWLRDLLDAGTSDPGLRASALEAAGSLAWRAGDYADAHRCVDEALGAARPLDDLKRCADALLTLAKVAASEGDADTAMGACREAISLARRIDDGAVRFWALIYLGWAHYIAGEVGDGDREVRAALEVDHLIDPAMATRTVHFGLQFGAFLAGDPAAQRAHLRAALGTMTQGVQEQVDWLAACATLAAVEGRPHTAMRLLGGANARTVRRGSQYPEQVLVPVMKVLEAASASIGGKLTDRLVALGEKMSWPELVALAMTESRRDEPLLSPRETEVAHLVAQGLTNAEIARRLVVSIRTVESHLDHIRRKLGFASRRQIIVWILQDTAERPGP
jgi:predicted ATPase/DNA-binding CsgD family transcriptional regulator